LTTPSGSACDLAAQDHLDFTVNGMADFQITYHAPSSDLPGSPDNSPSLAVSRDVNGDVTVLCSAPATESAHLGVYDLRGRLVKTLSNGLAGSQRLSWSGQDDYGRRAATGIYFCTLSYDRTVITRKFTWIR
jgi:hypothetical protein